MPKPYLPRSERFRRLEQARQAYIANEGTLETVAERFGLARRTVERAAATENWRNQTATVGEVVARTAVEHAMEKGRDLADLAGELVRRQFVTATKMVDRVDQSLDGSPSASELRHLAAAVCDAYKLGRQSVGLGEGSDPRGPVAVNIAIQGSLRPVSVEVDERPF